MQTAFSFEVPIKHLELFEDFQDFHFTLSMLYSESVYSTFYLWQKKLGLKTIWLDNSYNEKMKADSAHELIPTFKVLGAHKVISPDDPSWPLERIKAAYLNMCVMIPSEQVIVVVNSPQMLQEMKQVGASNFALSYWVRPKLTPEELYEMRECHFLGLLDPFEISRCNPRSCDTSMPIKLALQKKTIEEWIEEGCPHVNTKDLGKDGMDFFHRELTEEEIELSMRNIIDLKEVCQL
jgi:hypothetical protein